MPSILGRKSTPSISWRQPAAGKKKYWFPPYATNRPALRLNATVIARLIKTVLKPQTVANSATLLRRRPVVGTTTGIGEHAIGGTIAASRQEKENVFIPFFLP